MSDNETQPDQPEGVTVDEPTEPALNPEDDDLNQPPVDGPSGEGRDGPGDTSQGTPGGDESPESAD